MAEFRVESGVKQGDPLSPTLFSLVIDTVKKKNLICEEASPLELNLQLMLMIY
jgi:hypothetical protein